jgi:hypothetical protein
VRHHVQVQAELVFPDTLVRRAIPALSAMVASLMDRPEALDVVVAHLAPLAELDVTLALRAARQLEVEFLQAQDRQRAA